jgi:hypothetical protein
MAYNKINKLLMYKHVIEIVKKHYIAEVTTYKGIYKKHVYPVYPMSYDAFLRIINTRNIEKKLEEAYEQSKKGRRRIDK